MQKEDDKSDNTKDEKVVNGETEGNRNDEGRMKQHPLFNLARSQIGYLISSHDILYHEKSRLVKDLELVDNRMKDNKEMLEKLEGKNDRVSFQKKCLFEYEYKGYQKKRTKVNLEIAKITLKLRNLRDVIEKKTDYCLKN